MERHRDIGEKVIRSWGRDGNDVSVGPGPLRVTGNTRGRGVMEQILRQIPQRNLLYRHPDFKLLVS